ncbi:MAG: hypothetical protein CMI79_01945 [Candidatus Pelagibacter sp.]|nr:hypothetical protein [Candidatus Pelagibacter sp.]|tara:strand:- start:4412 stop:6166 length:1755 start_codon:yes stop_codon:yes gene_type:complete
MSLTKLLNLSKFLILLVIFFFLRTNIAITESIDIWKKQKENVDEPKIEEEKSEKKKSKIDISNKNKNFSDIKISENDESLDNPVQLIGLFDPEKNDLSLNMWSGTDGPAIRDIFKRIEKVDLSNFSEKIFIKTIFTYSHSPKGNFSEKEFLDLKLNWLIKNNKVELIENFLNTNLEFSGRSKLIKYLVDHYIALADISQGCQKASFINKEIKDNYLEKFRVYCLVQNKKKDEAQLNFDLLREQGKSDKFFDNKILFLLGINEKSDNKISDKNLLYFYLSSITVEDFKYEPNQKTDKNIWKYLTASNLLSIDKLEDPEIINKYEIAANQGTFEKSKIFEIYLSIPFNINQLINANKLYQGLAGYEARALIYQKILLSDNVENKLELLFLLKDLFNKEKLNNIFSEYLSDTLKAIDPSDVPEEFKKIVQKNIISEKNIELGKIKFDDKVLHRSKVVKLFTEDNPNKEKINKDFLNIYKKISRNKKYFFSIKDVILLETLSSDGIKMPKDLDIDKLSEDLTVPSNINTLVENNEIGMLMLKLVEIIGSDELQNLDPETLYFIVNLLNKAKIKKVRNQILNLTLPLRV